MYKPEPTFQLKKSSVVSLLRNLILQRNSRRLMHSNRNFPSAVGSTQYGKHVSGTPEFFPTKSSCTPDHGISFSQIIDAHQAHQGGEEGGGGKEGVKNDFQQNLKESGEDERVNFGRLKMTVHFGVFWRFA